MLDLNKPRLVIDQIDQSMKELFLKRLAVVNEVITYKKAFGLPIYDPKREHDMIERQLEGVDETLKPYYKAFLQSVIAI